MRAIAFACLLPLTVGVAAPARADRLPEHANEVVDYAISARLDAVAKRVDGRERITWRNPSTDTVGELWFHLYLNAFKNSKSTFYRESGGQLRGDRAAADKWGYLDVVEMKLVDGTDLAPSMSFEHPDDDNADDQTVARVRLPRPVPPGGSVSLDIAWKAQLPQVFARTGYRRDFFLVGQWFPKLGVYEPAGMRGRTTGGWNCHQFHAHSEFYADYGHYKVDVTVPSRFVVGATGPRVARRDNPDGTVTYVHEQSDVHDFAWTADPNYIEIKRTFSASEDVTPQEYEAVARLLDRPLEEVRLGDVEITLLLQPGHAPQAERHIEAAKLGLKWFGLWYGRYPYPTLTVVDPGPGAGGAGGMEYPTFITAGTSFLLNGWPFDRIRMPEGATVHEFGHQFWYGLVGNNEFEEAWLDEGFNSYSTGKVMDIGYGADTSGLYFLGLRLGTVESERAQNSLERRFDRIRTPAWEYSSSNNYAFNSYARPALVLRTLEGVLGAETMARVMRTYHERWRFRHPSSDDFYAVASEVSGKDLCSYFSQVVEASGVLDDAVVSVRSEKLPEPLGIFDAKTGRLTVDGKEAARREKEADERKARQYRNTVELRRRGELVFPVEVELTFDGTPPERRIWDARERWAKWEYVRPQRLLSARIDPDRKAPLDASWLNNARRVQPDARAASAWTARVLFWAQQALALLAM
jgi:hypothetical protein